MEELSLENILGEDQIEGLGLDGKETPREETKEDAPKENFEKENNTSESTEVNPDELFTEDKPESVSSGEEKGKEDTESTSGSTSHTFYSSIANALVEDGVFQSFSKDDVKKVDTADDFALLISKEVESRLDETQKRINSALGYGVEPTEVQKYEKYLSFLNSLDEGRLSDEGSDGENLRKNLIYQDYINRGFSKDRALKEVDRSISAGTDIEDAKEALKGNKEFYTNEYNSLIEKGKQESEAEEKKIQEQAKKFKDSIINEEKAFGDIALDKYTRQQVYDTIMKPVTTDPETGEKLSTLQQYERDNRTDFLKNVGLLYVLTDGFKDINKLVQGKVKQEMRKGLKELEHTISNTSRLTDGSLNYVSGSDPNSKFTKWDIDI